VPCQPFRTATNETGYEIVTHGIGDIASRNPQDKRHSSIRYFNVPYFHWIDGPANGKTVLCHTFQRLDLMAKMPIDKLTPVIGENFPHSHSFQLVSRRTIERSEVMDLVANTAIKKLIMNHSFSSGLPIGSFTSQACQWDGEGAQEGQRATSKNEKQIRSCAEGPPPNWHSDASSPAGHFGFPGTAARPAAADPHKNVSRAARLSPAMTGRLHLPVAQPIVFYSPRRLRRSFSPEGRQIGFRYGYRIIGRSIL
jgi:hypothetical protein